METLLYNDTKNDSFPDAPLIIIYGARNTGKTTLAKRFENAEIIEQLGSFSGKDGLEKLNNLLSGTDKECVVLVDQAIKCFAPEVRERARLVIQCSNPGSFSIKTQKL